MNAATYLNDSRISTSGLRVIILTEGGGALGMGHIGRCTALAVAFVEQGCALVMGVNSPPGICKAMPGYELTNGNWVQDPNLRKRLVDGADIVVLDSYLASAAIVHELASSTYKMVVIDDAARLAYPDNVVIVNPNIGAEAIYYHGLRNEHLLCGPQYAMLRSQFAMQRPHEYRKKIEHAVVTLGGSEQGARLVVICRAIRKLLPCVSITMIAPRSLDRSAVFAQLEGGPPIAVLQDLPANLIRDIFSDADFAISAAGQTVAELAWCGTPTLLSAIADNQRGIAQGWSAAGFAKQIPLPEEDNFLEALSDAIAALQTPEVRAERGMIGQKLVDGGGAGRVAKHLIAQCQSERVMVRQALPEDSRALLAISNQSDVRESSFTTKIIELDEHLNWFNHRLADPNCLFLVAQVGQRLGGQMRLDVAGDVATIAVSVDTSLRSLKVGATLFRESVAKLREHCPEVRQIKALIRADNAGSVAFFRRLGFERTALSVIGGTMAEEYRYQM